MIRKIFHTRFFIKLLHWEYWSFHVVYGPIYLYWFWLCIRARSFFFFNTSNPSIGNGGFLMESKKAIYDLLPKGSYPATFLFKPGASSSFVADTIWNSHLNYPLVGKPDIGMQGIAVKKLENEKELIEYASNAKVDFLVQGFVPYQHEVGIFYYRYPGEQKGNISGIVSKEFLGVKGDGISSTRELLKKDKRYILQLPVLEKTYGKQLDNVLAEGEEFILVPYGNHVRGAKFIDASAKIDETLIGSIDEVCRNIKGFYYGRLDIRYNTWEELKEGKNFSIIELNGAGSEPTHIYDPKHSIFFAWREIIRHWNILFRISRINHKQLRKPYMKTSSGLQMLRKNKQYVRLISGVQQ